MCTAEDVEPSKYPGMKRMHHKIRVEEASREENARTLINVRDFCDTSLTFIPKILHPTPETLVTSTIE
jgi:hypothetical protein